MVVYRSDRLYLLVESKVLVTEWVKPHNVACRKPNDDIQVITAACKNVDIVRCWESLREGYVRQWLLFIAKSPEMKSQVPLVKYSMEEQTRVFFSTGRDHSHSAFGPDHST